MTSRGSHLAGNATAPADATTRQEVRFCRSRDGVRIAYAVHGQGPPLVIDSCWLSHLQYDWQSPVWRHFLEDLGAICRVIRYDERGHGLSDRDVDDYSLPSRVADLEAVVAAAGLERFALLGMSQGGPVAIDYAVRHADRVTRLILFGAASTLTREQDSELRDTFLQMIRVGWSRSDSLFRRVFTNMLIPDASEEQLRWVDDLQRVSTSADNAVRFRAERQSVDVTDRLPLITAPALVLHSRGDEAVRFAEARILASSIPDARLVPLDSRNHILLADEPARHVFIDEVAAFVEPDRDAAPTAAPLTPVADLTRREFEILRLAATGLGNRDIAEALVLSVRTIERHLSNAYLKLGVGGRAGRTAVVADLVRRGLA